CLTVRSAMGRPDLLRERREITPCPPLVQARVIPTENPHPESPHARLAIGTFSKGTPCVFTSQDWSEATQSAPSSPLGSPARPRAWAPGRHGQGWALGRTIAPPPARRSRPACTRLPHGGAGGGPIARLSTSWLSTARSPWRARR